MITNRLGTPDLWQNNAAKPKHVFVHEISIIILKLTYLFEQL
jgi:hypothetical protein